MVQRSYHIDNVISTAQSASAAAHSAVAASWRRSMLVHDLDPGERRRALRMTEGEQNERRARSGRLLDLAEPHLDRLFALVGSSGCGVFLSDDDGVILEHRCNDRDVAAFDDWNLWRGAHWGEAHEGTNGIGTCLVEGRSVVIHRDEHFAMRNTAMSCIDTPIHGPEGHIVGALDISSARSDQSAAYNRLMADATAQTARQIETGLFGLAFPGCRIVMADAEGSAVLAVDRDDVIVGASRAARKLFGLISEGPLNPCPAVDLLGEDPGRRGFDRAEHAAIKRALLRNNGNATAAARDLGIGRATFYRRAKKLGLNGA